MDWLRVLAIYNTFWRAYWKLKSIYSRKKKTNFIWTKIWNVSNCVHKFAHAYSNFCSSPLPKLIMIFLMRILYFRNLIEFLSSSRNAFSLELTLHSYIHRDVFGAHEFNLFFGLVFSTLRNKFDWKYVISNKMPAQ